MDLREAKGWSYGVIRRLLGRASMPVPYVVSAPVQADRTGDSMAALNSDIGQFLTTSGVTQEELRPHGRRTASTGCPASSRPRARCWAR